jgi:hypothetical protein
MLVTLIVITSISLIANILIIWIFIRNRDRSIHKERLNVRHFLNPETTYDPFDYYKEGSTTFFYDEAYEFILFLETRHGILLTDNARRMLILPLLDMQKIIIQASKYNFGKRDLEYEFQSWRQSIEKLLDTITFDPARIDTSNFIESPQNERSSISVIKAYAERFCNIPPFCGER